MCAGKFVDAATAFGAFLRQFPQSGYLPSARFWLGNAQYATGFLKHGHEVMIGTRSRDKVKDWQEKNPRGNVGSNKEAAGWADIIVPGNVTEWRRLSTAIEEWGRIN